jgi:hypothetical protein
MQDRFLNALDPNSVHAAGRRVVILAVNIDEPGLERPRLFFRLRCASQTCHFVAKIIFAARNPEECI